MRLNYSAATDLGQVRQVNEDRFLVAPLADAEGGSALFDKGALFMVADGMGGANAGDQAAQITVEVIGEAFLEGRELAQTEQELVGFLRNSIFRAHDTIVRRSLADPQLEGMGTTLVMLYLIEDKGHLFWVGDSRLYRLRKNDLEPSRPVDHGDLRLLTDDHSVVWDDIISGNLSEIDARDGGKGHIITNSLGDPMHSPFLGELVLDVQVDDRFLLCSDGLNAMVDAKEIHAILTESADVDRTVQRCVSSANAQGGKDNITAVLVDVYEIFAANPFLERNTSLMAAAKAPVHSIPTPEPYPGKGKSRTGIWAFLFLAVFGVGVLAYFLYANRDTPQAIVEAVGTEDSSSSSIRMLEPKASDDQTNFFDAVAEIDRVLAARRKLAQTIENATNVFPGDHRRLKDEVWIWHEDAQEAKERVKRIYVDSEKKRIVNSLIQRLQAIEAAFHAAVAKFEKEKERERQEQLEIERLKKERAQAAAPKLDIKENKSVESQSPKKAIEPQSPIKPVKK